MFYLRQVLALQLALHAVAYKAPRLLPVSLHPVSSASGVRSHVFLTASVQPLVAPEKSSDEVEPAVLPAPHPKPWHAAAASAVTVTAPVLALLGIERVLRAGLRACGISFPHSIVGMLGGFGALLALRSRRPRAADEVAAFFAPGCQLLSVWLAVIFAPAFITLPVTMPPTPPRVLLSFIGLVIGGFFMNTAINSALVSTLGRFRWGIGGGAGANCGSTNGDAKAAAGSVATPTTDTRKDKLANSETQIMTVPPPPPPPSPFPPSQQKALGAATAVSTLGSIALYASRGSVGLAPYVLVRDVSQLCATLFAFSAANRLPRAFNKAVHPFVTCAVLMQLFCAATAAAVGGTWKGALVAYHARAGTLISSLMAPTVVSFAFSLYRFRSQLAARAPQIIGVALCGSLSSMIASAIAARLLTLPPALALNLLPRSTTTAIGTELARITNAPPALGLLAAFVTGLLSINLGKPVLRALRVSDPAQRGIALSAASHGGAVLVLADEPQAFPFAVLMLSLSAAATLSLLSLTPVRNAILTLALGAKTAAAL
mmetsp:Transcript_21431/g.45228  ORF Transcript_21431/g.45228 Transcript_21431/m.45228 type:complete len:544 (-) Transcript_21431:407-2038(-)